MRICYCDGCGVELDNPNRFEIPCHLWSKRGEVGYVGTDRNQVSGRKDGIDLCNKCLNSVYTRAVRQLLAIRGGDNAD